MNDATLFTLFLLVSIGSITIVYKTFKTDDPAEKVFFCIMTYVMFIFPLLCVFLGALSSAME